MLDPGSKSPQRHSACCTTSTSSKCGRTMMLWPTATITTKGMLRSRLRAGTAIDQFTASGRKRRISALSLLGTNMVDQFVDDVSQRNTIEDQLNDVRRRTK